MINKLKMSLESGNDNVCISKEEAAEIFKVLLSVSAMFDSGWLADGRGNITVNAAEFLAVKQSWDQMVNVEEVE